jgi:hypothetical protein
MPNPIMNAERTMEMRAVVTANCAIASRSHTNSSENAAEAGDKKEAKEPAQDTTQSKD